MAAIDKHSDEAEPASDDSPAAAPHILSANRAAWDRMARAGKPLCQPATDAELADPLRQVDPLGWLGPSLHGWQVLCLAAGGGRHSALYAAAGAAVTVVDLSSEMLELDRQVAAARGYQVRVIEASMERLPMLATATFDLVIHPVSTCYVQRLGPVFAEVARLVRPGGLYVSQHKQPTSLQAATSPLPEGGYALRHTYYRQTPVPPPERTSRVAERLREAGTHEFLHRWEELLGGICRAGFVIEDLVEPLHTGEGRPGDPFAARAQYVAPYVRLKARRRDDQPAVKANNLWLP